MIKMKAEKKRALNPLLVTIFLIIIAVILSALFYMWITGAFQRQMQYAQLMIKQKKFIATESKVYVEIVLRNVGTKTVTVVSVTLIDPNTNNEIGELESPSGVVKLGSGEEAVYSGSFDKGTFKKGETYIIKIMYKVDDQLNTMTEGIKYEP